MEGGINICMQINVQMSISSALIWLPDTYIEWLGMLISPLPKITYDLGAEL